MSSNPKHANLDRSLDEILAARRGKRASFGNNDSRNRNRGGERHWRAGRPNYLRDGVKKSFRDDSSSRRLDLEWIHDKYDDYGSRRSDPRRWASTDATGSSRLRVDNLHWELTEEELMKLFNQIGPVLHLELRYDRAGRSDGTAFVAYESTHDARRAQREYNGANAYGQPIRISFVPDRPAGRHSDTSRAGRALADRITGPSGRSRSLSPGKLLDDEAARKGIDRYRPGQAGSQSRSPMRGRRHEQGRRPGALRHGDRNGGNRGDRGGHGRNPRPKKTTEELDAEMSDYFGVGGDAHTGAAQNGPVTGAASAAVFVNQQPVEDIDMIE